MHRDVTLNYQWAKNILDQHSSFRRERGVCDWPTGGMIAKLDFAGEYYGDKADYHDVQKDSSKLEEMLKYWVGIRKVPVIIEAGKVTIGFGGNWGV